MAALEDLHLAPMITVRRFAGASYKSIAQELRVLFPGVRGMSARSVKRLCRNHGIQATSRLSNEALDRMVAFGIGMVRSW